MKNKIKVLVICITTVLLSGCSVNYNINISEETRLSENVNIKEDYNTFYDKSYSFFDTTPETYSGQESAQDQYIAYYLNGINEKYFPQEKGKSPFYENNTLGKEVTDDEFQITIKSILSHSYIDINDSMMFKKFANTVISKKTDDTYKLEISNINKQYFEEIDDITITITTPYKAISTNASESSESANNNTYTWKYNDVTDIDIKIELDIKDPSLNAEQSYILIIIVISSILSLALIAFVIIKIINKKNNKI